MFDLQYQRPTPNEELKNYFSACYEERFKEKPFFSPNDLGIFEELKRFSGKDKVLYLIQHFFSMSKEEFHTYGYTPLTLSKNIGVINDDYAKKNRVEKFNTSLWVKFMFLCKCQNYFEVTCRAITLEIERDHLCQPCCAARIAAG